MKKRVIFLIIVIAIVLAVPSAAAETRAAVIQPALSFTNNKANCSLVVVGDLANEPITATIKLKQGSITLATWNVDDVGALVFSDSSISVTKGGTYTLTANVTINNRVYAPTSITATNR